MNFYQAYTFMESLTKLQANQQKTVTESVNLMLKNHAHPSLQLHRLGKAKDQNMWYAQ